MRDRFEGDPKIVINENGSDLVFNDTGQPVMDRGLENASTISMFTEKGWCGNVFFSNPNQQIGSDYEKTARQPITISSINDLGSQAEKAHAWMVNTDVASAIFATSSNPQSNRLETAVLIEPPGKDPEVLLAKKHGQNWVYQKIDPAYLRV